MMSAAFSLLAQAPAGAAPQSPSMLGGLAMPLLLIVMFYFMLIRPQMKRSKEHKAMMTSLQKGDEVITGGGLVGKITKVSDAYVTVEVAQAGNNPVEMHFQKASVQVLLPKGTIKAI